MIRRPNCHYRQCIHYQGIVRLVEDDEGTEVPVCKAFPDNGIPPDIAFGSDLHMEVHILQDNTITYQRKKKKSP